MRLLYLFMLVIMQAGILPAQQAVIIDHTSLHLFDSIPPGYLEKARNLRMHWMNRSVGGNISQGLDCFAAADFFGSTSANGGYLHPAYCRRYYTDPNEVGYQKPFTVFTHQDYLSGHVPDPILHHPDREQYDRSNWVYEFWGDDPTAGSTGQWFEKVDYFLNRSDHILTADPEVSVLSFQFSYLEVDGGESVPIESETVGYFSGNPARPGYLDVEAWDLAHPEVTVLHWTTSMALIIGTETAATFNDQMRQFAQDNGKYLLDAAAILTHDPDGNPCYGVTPETAAWPAICPHYTTEQHGGHLGSVSAGMIRMGKAMWIMMARIAGWDGNMSTDPDTNLIALPIVHPNHLWYVEISNLAGSDNRRLRFAPDSVQLNGLYYRMLQESATESLDDWYDLAFYRQEGAQVWRHHDQMPEELIYDFALMVGDTFQRLQFGIVEVDLLVTAVDTIFLADSLPRKRISLACADDPGLGDSFYWVEGLGGFDADILWHHPACMTDGSGFLTCFYSDGEELYRHAGVTGCFSTTSNQMPDGIRWPEIYPNPTSDILYLRGAEGLKHFTLTDLLGRSVREGPLTVAEISVAGLPDGLYFLRLQDAAGRSSVVRVAVAR